ncbi:hypothetical protein Avbf_03828 [Armadillidium vulgare]|nr:hypothetical protein Avbf_03828 [Armadillidium vulgare]
MAAMYRSMIKSLDKLVPPRFHPFWNHPAEFSYSRSWRLSTTTTKACLQLSLVHWQQQEPFGQGINKV